MGEPMYLYQDIGSLIGTTITLHRCRCGKLSLNFRCPDCAAKHRKISRKYMRRKRGGRAWRPGCVGRPPLSD